MKVEGVGYYVEEEVSKQCEATRKSGDMVRGRMVVEQSILKGMTRDEVKLGRNLQQLRRESTKR